MMKPGQRKIFAPASPTLFYKPLTALNMKCPVCKPAAKLIYKAGMAARAAEKGEDVEISLEVELMELAQAVEQHEELYRLKDGNVT